MKRLFLNSSSYYSGGNGTFMGHCFDALKEFLGPIEGEKNTVLFVPYADPDMKWDEYTEKASKPFKEMGYEFIGIHAYANPSYFQLDPKIAAIFIGGGNTWLLNQFLHDFYLVSPIREAVNHANLKYIGSSAGTLVACRSIITTNDMSPIENPVTEGLYLIPFQINAHFVSGALIAGHMGETREERIRQVLVHKNEWEVVCIPEGCWIESRGHEYTFHGPQDGVVINSVSTNPWKPNEKRKIRLDKF